MIVNDIRVIWPKLAKIGFYRAGRAQKWKFLTNFCSGVLDCSFGMKKWTNKFYRDFEGQAKIGCSSLCVVPALRDRNWWLNNIASGTDTSRLLGLILLQPGQRGNACIGCNYDHEKLLPHKIYHPAENSSTHCWWSLLINYLHGLWLKQWSKSRYTHTQSQAHGCCRIHTLQRPSVHTPGQLWENKSWYSSRWCSSSTDW